MSKVKSAWPFPVLLLATAVIFVACNLTDSDTPSARSFSQLKVTEHTGSVFGNKISGSGTQAEPYEYQVVALDTSDKLDNLDLRGLWNSEVPGADVSYEVVSVIPDDPANPVGINSGKLSSSVLPAPTAPGKVVIKMVSTGNDDYLGTTVYYKIVFTKVAATMVVNADGNIVGATGITTTASDGTALDGTETKPYVVTGALQHAPLNPAGLVKNTSGVLSYTVTTAGAGFAVGEDPTRGGKITASDYGTIVVKITDTGVTAKGKTVTKAKSLYFKIRFKENNAPVLTGAETVITEDAATDSNTPVKAKANADDKVTITLTFTKAVAVTSGTNDGKTYPLLTLGAINAQYNKAATDALGDATKVVFSYTVPNSSPPADGSYSTANYDRIDLGTDSDGNPVGSITSADNGLAAVRELVYLDGPISLDIDTAAPTVIAPALISEDEKTSLKAGDPVYVALTFDDQVRVKDGASVPTITLKIPSGNKTVTYDADATTVYGDTNTLVFSYPVASGDSGAISVDDVAITGGVNILDLADNAFGNSATIGATPGSLTADGDAPTVDGTAFVQSGKVKAGADVDLTLTFSEAVYVTGKPKITLSGITGTADYVDGTGTTQLTFRHHVTPSDTNAAVKLTTAADRLTLNDSSIKDAAGNAYVPAALVSAEKTGPTVDTTAPTLGIGPPSPASLKAGETATYSLTFSEEPKGFDVNDIAATNGTLSNPVAPTEVTSPSDPDLGKWRGGVTFTPNANFDGKGGITVANGSFTDAAGNEGTVTGGGSAALTIDTEAPTVTISGPSSIGSTSDGVTVTFTLSEVSTDFAMVDVAAPDANLTSFTGSGTVYSVTVKPKVDKTQVSVSVAAGAFTDAAGNANVASTPLVLTADGVAPTVLSSSISPQGATNKVKVGDNIEITVNFSEDVTVTGTPTIALTGLQTTRNAEYVSGSRSLLFRYTVDTGDTGPVTVIGTTELVLPAGSSIEDAAGNAYDSDVVNASGLTGPTVDTTAPTLAIGTPSSTSLKAGETATYSLTFGEEPTGFDVSSDIVAAGGTVALTTPLGEVTTPGADLGKWKGGVTFTPDSNFEGKGGITVANGTFTDAAGNEGTVTGGSSTALTIDTKAPEALTVTMPPTLTSAGTTLSFDVTFSEKIKTSANPTIKVKKTAADGTVSYLSATATADNTGNSKKVTFTATIAAPSEGDTFTVESYTAIKNGAEIKDAAGNPLVRTFVIAGDSVTVDNPPQITGVTMSGLTATGTSGNVVVTFSEPVNLTGTPADITIPVTVSTSPGAVTEGVAKAVSASGNKVTFTYDYTGATAGTTTFQVAANAPITNFAQIVDTDGTATAATSGSLTNGAALTDQVPSS